MTGQLDGTVVKDRVDACGLDIYYEVHGAGEPLLSPGVSLERLRDVQSPTLVLVGDDDCVTPEHAAAMVRALPAGSQLGVVPGTSHGLPFEKPDLVDQLILDFLQDQQTEKMIRPADEP